MLRQDAHANGFFLSAESYSARPDCSNSSIFQMDLPIPLYMAGVTLLERTELPSTSPDMTANFFSVDSEYVSAPHFPLDGGVEASR